MEPSHSAIPKSTYPQTERQSYTTDESLNVANKRILNTDSKLREESGEEQMQAEFDARLQDQACNLQQSINDQNVIGNEFNRQEAEAKIEMDFLTNDSILKNWNKR